MHHYAAFPWIGLVALTLALPVNAQNLPPNFVEEVVFAGLGFPTNVEFASDGRVFISEKSGRVNVFDSLTDTEPDTAIDLRTEVMDFWDRGMLGLALHPNFPETPYVYVLYAYDAPLGQTAPVWNDTCADATGNGCQAQGRLSRFQIGTDNQLIGGEEVLISNQFCQQGPGHSLGDLEFGPDGSLYVSSGDGAQGNLSDIGNAGNDPAMRCTGDAQDQGGALRAQDVLTSGDPASYDGALLRVDANTGKAVANNSLSGGVAGDDAVVAFGFRNPFRFAIRPGTSEVWLGDVGWGQSEEINRIVSATDSVSENYGWPCYEGNEKQGGYTTVAFCQKLYNNDTFDITNSLTSPVFAYEHRANFGSTDCDRGVSGSISGLDFYQGGNVPAEYQGALVFSDFSRKCLWAMQTNAQGVPDPSKIVTLVAHPQAGSGDAPGPVDVERGIDGHMYYVDLLGGTLRRIRYQGGVSPSNNPPIARITADKVNGVAPLTVGFDSSKSSDPDGDTLSFSWDLDGNGALGDSMISSATFTYSTAGAYLVRLRVTDSKGAASFADLSVNVSDDGPPPPELLVELVSPKASDTWQVGEPLTLTSTATLDGLPVPQANFRWEVLLHHCPEQCHQHTVQAVNGTSSTVFNAPDHEYPAFLEFRVTVNDGEGRVVTKSVSVDPSTTSIAISSQPEGLDVVLGPKTISEASTVEVIRGSSNSISVISPAMLNGDEYRFVSWSNGNDASHIFQATEATMSLVANYELIGPAPDAGIGGVGGAGASASVAGDSCAIGYGTKNTDAVMFLALYVALIWRRRLPITIR